MLILSFSALTLSVLVTLVAYRILSSRLSPPTSKTTHLVVAATRLSLGTKLGDEHLKVLEWPQGIQLEGAFNDPKVLVGRGVIIGVSPNEPILESKLAPKEGGSGMMSAIPEGMRAVSVKVNDVIGVAGFVIPGTRVDVILIGSPERHDADTSKVILENVQVLAAGQNVEQDVNGKPQNVQVITLLVDPEDAQKLALASVDGRIQLALRNPLDLERKNTVATRKAALFTSASAMPPEKPALRPMPARKLPASIPVVTLPPIAAENPKPRILKVELIQGSEKKSVDFEFKNEE